MDKEIEIAKENLKRKKEVFEGCGDRTSTGGTCGKLSKTKELCIYDEGTKKETYESTKVKRFCEECWKEIFELKGTIFSHKRTCERFLNFLNKHVSVSYPIKENDLRETINLYEKEGIK